MGFLSIEKTKPKYKVSQEVYRGKKTGRYIISQDCRSFKLRHSLNK